ncbi:MAG: trigger factor [Deltaproteobacteria bacterium]|nr:trigger factor [Deltaproteobacteria bacterium]
MSLDVKSEIKELSKVERELSITIPGSVIAKELDRAYRSLGSQVNLKGFRKGKVPRQVLEKYYREDTEAKVMERVVQNSYMEAIDEHKLTPVASPNVEAPNQLISGMDFSYTAKVEVKPEFDLEKVEGLEIKKVTFTAGDDDVAEQLEKLRKSFEEIQPVEGRDTAQQGDLVETSCSATLGDAHLKGIGGVSFMIEIGSGNFFAEAEQALIGKKLEETVEVEVEVPDDYSIEEAQGKKISLTIVPQELKSRTLPELNDDFAQDVDEKMETLDALKKNILDELDKAATNRSKAELQDACLMALIEANPFELAPAMVDSQAERLAAEKLQRFPREQAQMLWQQMGEQLKNDARDLATKQVRGGLILEQLNQDQKIEVSEEEIDAQFEEMAKTAETTAKKLKNIYKKSDRLDEVRHQLATEKALGFVLSKAKLEESSQSVLAEYQA